MPDKPGIAVIEFATADHEMWWRSKGAGEVQDVFNAELTKSRKFRVLEREQLDAMVREKDLTLYGDVSPMTAMKAGKLLGVGYLLTGALMEFGHDGPRTPLVAQMRARMIDTSTGETVWSDEASVRKPSERFNVEDSRMFDLLLKPVVQELTASLKSADIGG